MPDFEPIIGRYLTVDIEGAAYRVHIEEAGQGIPLVCLTAYTYPVARLLDDHVDLLLVGDSVAMVLHGHKTTLGASLEMMIAHGQAVMRGSAKACVVVDMPDVS